MKYPYLKVVHEEVADGGFLMFLADMILFAIKVFIFVGVGYLALWSVGIVVAKYMSDHLSPECISQLVPSNDTL